MSIDAAVIEVKIGSNRNFGLVFAAVFLIVALWPLLGENGIRWWALIVSVALLAVTFMKPELLTKPNHYWFKFGILLGAIVAPIVMGLVFLLTIIPIGLVFRLMGKDLLRTKLDRSAKSYWLNRDTPMQSMKNQF